MADKLPFFAAESGTYKTTSPNPHVDLSGTALTLGTYPVHTFAAAAADATLDFATTNTCSVTVWKDASNWARYEGAAWTDGTPDTLDLSAATLMGTAGTLTGDDTVSVVASLPVPLQASLVSTAALTVLDDATVADMVATLGGAASTGTGGLARATSPTFVTPILGTPTSGTLTNCTGYPAASTSAAGVAPQATAPAAGLRNVLGIDNAETAYSNKALFDATNPAALGTASPGTEMAAARRDHVHATPKLDDLATPDDNTDLNASTSAHGLAVKATAPASGSLNVVGIGNAETAYTNKTIFEGALKIVALSDAAYAALSPPTSTTIYITTG